MRTCVEQYNYILNHKAFFSGIAILMVVLTHVGIVDSHRFWILFYPGFLGVDIFMLFSGYGLCYSYQKNSIQSFYKRRMVKILPLFFLLTTSITLIACLKGKELSLWDWICNITSLNYYRMGGFYIEWYLCSLLVYYLSFPILFLWIKKISPNLYTSFLGLIEIICIAVSLFLDEEYSCSIGRIPIFILGILLFVDIKKLRRFLAVFGFSSLIVGLFVYNKLLPTFYLLYTLLPIALLLVAQIGRKSIKLSYVKNIMEVIGKYTLEIYVANIFICYTMVNVECLHLGSLAYFAAFLFLVPILIKINKLIK